MFSKLVIATSKSKISLKSWTCNIAELTIKPWKNAPCSFWFYRSQHKNSCWRELKMAQENFERLPKMSEKPWMSTSVQSIHESHVKTILFLFWDTLFLQIISSKNVSSSFLVWRTINNSCWWYFGKILVLIKKF